MLLPISVRHALVAVMLVVAGSVVASAQDDPPARVARLNYISGQVSFRPASLDEWGSANLNYPLTTGDHLWTERGARAELQLGPSVIRLASETAFAFLDLDDDVLQARMAEGSIYIRVRELGPHETYEIDTPNAAVSIVRPGVYRIDVDPDGTRTRVAVRTGLAQVNGADGAFSVDAGDSADITGTEEMTYEISRASSPDTWERWCLERDQREDNRVALRYVSNNMVGYEDLDDYGTWSYEPEYGYAWTPTVVAVDWAPYRYGHWSFVRPWGWTWVDDARWGFAPFHYGRWAHNRDRWMWIPGHYVARPVYAPALVGFVGGLDWSFTFSLGARPAVGWFPLGPGEIYCPSYHVSPAYVRNVNVAHVNVTNINVTNYDVAHARYTNRGVPGAVTAVPREVFIGAQSVQRAAVAVPRGTVDRVPVVGHAIGVAPDARSFVGRSTSSIPRPPIEASRRPVLARTQPPSQVLHDTPVVALGSGARTRANAVPTRPDNPPAQTLQQPATSAPGNWRPAVRGRDVPTSRPDNSSSSTPAERSSASTPSSPRYETPRYGAPRYETPRYEAPRSDAPKYQAPGYARPAAPDRGAAQPERVAPNDDRPGRGQATTQEPAPARGQATTREPAAARGQATTREPAAAPRSEAPSRNDSPRSDSAHDRASSTPPADRSSSPSTSRPADRGGERKPPASGTGRGGQSEGTAKARGRG